MPFGRFESRQEAETHNNNQRNGAKMRWAKLIADRRKSKTRKPQAQKQARKPANRLEARLADWSRMMAQSKAPSADAFHRPGSMQK
jgi:hypothetical protein